MKIETFGKETVKDGIRTFSMTQSDIENEMSIYEPFKDAWNQYIDKTRPENIEKAFDKVNESRSELTNIPEVIKTHSNLAVSLKCSYNAEGRITFYPHRDLSMNLLLAYKFSIVQNYSLWNSTGYEYDYVLIESQEEIILPYGYERNFISL